MDVQIRVFDTAEEDAVKAVVDDAIARFGRLDIFFANAGIVGQNKLFTDVTGDELARTLRVNTIG